MKEIEMVVIMDYESRISLRMFSSATTTTAESCLFLKMATKPFNKQSEQAMEK